MLRCQHYSSTSVLAVLTKALFSIPEWEKRYSAAFELHHHECTVPYEGEGKGTCLECQMAKVCDGLVSGRYSIKQGCLFLAETNVVTVHPDGGKEESQIGIRPRMLKSLIGHGHAEFAGMKQQDAQEFFIWLLSRIQRQGKPSGCVEQKLIEAERDVITSENGWGGYVDPTNCFNFAIQQRIQCLGCGGVKYRVDQQDNINISVPDRLR
jgi:ubiquitin carboxyl-terminal hydrolase 5/13